MYKYSDIELLCPHCNSENITIDVDEIFDNWIACTGYCSDCGKTFIINYVVSEIIVNDDVVKSSITEVIDEQ